MGRLRVAEATAAGAALPERVAGAASTVESTHIRMSSWVIPLLVYLVSFDRVGRIRGCDGYRHNRIA